MSISQQKTAAFSHMFSSCQIENVNKFTTTSYERVIQETGFLSFSFWTETLLFKDIVNFVQLMLRKYCTCLIVWLDSIWKIRWDLVCTVVLIGFFTWFDKSGKVLNSASENQTGKPIKNVARCLTRDPNFKII